MIQNNSVFIYFPHYFQFYYFLLLLFIIVVFVVFFLLLLLFLFVCLFLFLFVCCCFCCFCLFVVVVIFLFFFFFGKQKVPIIYTEFLIVQDIYKNVFEAFPLTVKIVPAQFNILRIFITCRAGTQRWNNVDSTWFNVLNHRWISIVSTLCACSVRSIR